MSQKTVKEVVQNVFTGEVTVEYSDDTTKEFNIDELPVAKIVSGNVVLEVFGETLDLAASSSSAVTQAVAQAQALATILGTYTEGETLTVNLPTGWTASYQWTRGDVNISGETNSTYTLALDDVGAVVTCNVSNMVFTPVGDTVVGATP
jgi:redox-sensitive bicupin YhaK (pirin superfamily)